MQGDEQVGGVDAGGDEVFPLRREAPAALHDAPVLALRGHGASLLVRLVDGMSSARMRSSSRSSGRHTPASCPTALSASRKLFWSALTRPFIFLSSRNRIRPCCGLIRT